MSIVIKLFVDDDNRELNVVVLRDKNKRNKSTESQSMIVADFHVPLQFDVDSTNCEDIKLEPPHSVNEVEECMPVLEDNFIDMGNLNCENTDFYDDELLDTFAKSEFMSENDSQPLGDADLFGDVRSGELKSESNRLQFNANLRNILVPYKSKNSSKVTCHNTTTSRLNKARGTTNSKNKGTSQRKRKSFRFTIAKNNVLKMALQSQENIRRPGGYKSSRAGKSEDRTRARYERNSLPISPKQKENIHDVNFSTGDIPCNKILRVTVPDLSDVKFNGVTVKTENNTIKRIRRKPVWYEIFESTSLMKHKTRVNGSRKNDGDLTKRSRIPAVIKTEPETITFQNDVASNSEKDNKTRNSTRSKIKNYKFKAETIDLEKNANTLIESYHDDTDRPVVNPISFVLSKEPVSVQESKIETTENKDCFSLKSSNRLSWKYGFRLNHETANKRQLVYSCVECEYSADRKFDMKKHIKMNHLQKYVCDTCGYKTPSYRFYLVHKKRHQKGASYCCFHCNYICRCKKSLEVHLYTHTGEKPLACPMCDYRTHRKDVLKKHMQSKHP